MIDEYDYTASWTRSVIYAVCFISVAILLVTVFALENVGKPAKSGGRSVGIYSEGQWFVVDNVTKIFRSGQIVLEDDSRIYLYSGIVMDPWDPTRAQRYENVEEGHDE